MQIGIDISAVVYGTGVSDYTVNLVSALLAQYPDDYRLFGASLRRRQEIRSLFPQVHTVPIPPRGLDILWNQMHVIGVEKFLGKLDVFHSSDWAEPPCIAPKVTTIHDLSPFLYPAEIDPLIVAVHTRKMKWAVQECKKFICVSQNTSFDLQRLFAVPASKIQVISEALPARFLLAPRLTKHVNYVVAIGARQPRKNIARLISAYVKFKSTLSLPPRLIIIGEYAGSTSDPAVSYTGYVDDQTLVDLLAGAQAFVYPSLYEGFGLPILGAFQHQVPVAAAQTSSIPEVAGDAAIFFDPLDEEAIATSIKMAIENKAKLIKKGLAQLQKFSWSQTASQTVEVYKSLC